MKKAWLIGSYAIAAVILIVYRDPLVIWIESGSNRNDDLLVWIIGLLVAVVPVLPYGIVAAVIGAKYGIVVGTFVNVAISVLAAMILFSAVRLTFSKEERAKASQAKGLRKMTVLVERNAFFAIFFARLLPIVPAQAVNIYAAVTRIPWFHYLVATIFGKIPFIILVTLLGNRFFQDANIKEMAIIVGIYGALIGLVYGVYRFYVKENPKTQEEKREAE